MDNTITVETATHKGITITVKWYYDIDGGEPWDNSDGHGPVSEWTRREKLPSERVLSSDHGSCRYYDFQEAVRIAKRDGWDAKPFNTGTKGEQAARAVEADFQHLKAWCNDEWHYAGYTVEIDGYDYDESLWGIESDSMDEYTKTAISDAIEWLNKELAESAACSDARRVDCQSILILPRCLIICKVPAHDVAMRQLVSTFQR
jgi:hypothetical protein